MKLPATLLLLAILFTACHDATENSHGHHTEPQATAETTAPVQLDKDHRWKADAATNKNVSWLQEKAAERNQQKHTTAAHYQQTGAALQTGLNQLIKECTMKGPEHDALHLWLEPLLQDNRHLQKVTDVNAGDRLFYSIRNRLLDYNLYFN